MTGRPDWGSSALLATTVAGIALATFVAFVTIDAPPLPTRHPRVSTVPAPATPPVRLVEIKLPAPEVPATAPPSSADFAAKPAAPSAPPAAQPPKSDPSIDWASLPIEELRSRANASDLLAMEELARRLIQGTGVAKDPQAGAGWLLRAAEAGSPQAAFNVGVMYERGFVVERDSSKAVEWYRKAADGNMPAAKHNLALLLRDGKGAPRDLKRAIELLQSSARQGMSASMFSLGDVYERGDAGTRDPAAALAWFAIAAEFERQVNRGEDTPLSRTADQRSQALQRVLTPAELQRAQQMGQTEFRAIAEALAPPKPSPSPAETAPPAAPDAPPAISSVDLPSWPKAPNDQVRATQQALVDLRLLRDKPDGMLGPMTRNAIRDFQRSAGLKETGDPSKELYVAMRQAQARRDVEASSPLPLPARQEQAKQDEPKSGPPTPEPPAAPMTADIVRVVPKTEASPPPPSIDVARTVASTDPDAWPPDDSEQVKAIQRLLRDLKIFADPINGQLDPRTQSAIRDYERMAGLQETGRPSKALFDSLRETRALMAPKTGSN